MFGLFSSVDKKTRDAAVQWVETAEKIHDYRRDELSEADRTALKQSTEKLRGLVREKADASRVKLATEALEGILRQTGGHFYPRSGLQEFVEFFVVAAIVLLGLRAYFFQPFKIPTNSMWPTYNGMTPHVYKSGEDAPGAASQILRYATFGASHHNLIAPASGKLYLSSQLKPAKVRNFFVIPAPGMALTFSVDGREDVELVVPADFDYRWLLRDAFPGFTRGREVSINGARYLDLGLEVKQGDSFLRFDLLTGDQLFVDRLSYHFVEPQVGSAFVFRTRQIPELGGDYYYIKRLVGKPGDTLEVREPVLLRNGAPITGADAFTANNERKGQYTGYTCPPHLDAVYLKKGTTYQVPNDGYFAMGDNSSNSKDSRYWGHVPYKEVIGRPLFIYYPFHSHWGVAK